MLDRKRYISLFYNFITIVLVVVAIISIYMGSVGALSDNKLEAFKYFTVQSNIFVGITSILSIIFIIKDKEIPGWLFYLKLASATSVTITFSVVIFYLAPVMGFLLLYMGANFLMHLVVPLLAIFEIIFFTPRKELKYRLSLFSMLPVFIYGVFYLTNIVVNNGYGNTAYDWYLLGVSGIGTGIIAFFALLTFSFLVSLLFSFLNKKLVK